MATHDDTPGPEDWEDDEDDDLTDYEDMDESDLYFDDIESDDDEEEDEDFDDEPSDRYKSFSARRRIEIAREDKWLKSVMADFDDYEGLDDLGDRYTEEYSY